MDNSETNIKELQNCCIIRLVDDDENFLESMEILLQLKGWVARKYTNPVEFLESDLFHKPGCIVLDMRMPGMTGLEVQSYLNEIRSTHLPIIFLTGHGDVESAVHTLKHGAFDFLQKPVAPMRLLETVEKAAAHSVETLKAKKSISGLQSQFESLTKREREIFLSATDGLTKIEIDEKFNIGVATVKMHRANAFEKFNIHSLAEASKIVSTLFGAKKL